MKRSSSRQIVPLETIEERIFIIRGVKVILDVDLAELYGVPTKRLNEHVRRNCSKFPEDFMYQLTSEEVADLKSHFATSKTGEKKMRSHFATGSKRNIRYLPYAFTEYGALQAANVLNSPKAIAMSLYIIRAFVRLRTVFLDNQILQERLREIEEFLLEHDVALEDIYEKISQLFLLSKKAKAIDFDTGNGNS